MFPSCTFVSFVVNQVLNANCESSINYNLQLNAHC
jgi:hypothetical protein